MARNQHNTPGIIKYPFWQMAMENPQTVYVCLNRGEAFCPPQLESRALCLDADIGQSLAALAGEGEGMTRLEQLLFLNRELLAEMPQLRPQAARFARDEAAQWRLFRSLVNVRAPAAAGAEFLRVQDALLQSELARRGVTDAASLAPAEDGMALWQGDITTLRADAIVNAANSGLTGCYCPCHGCIDNAIHTYSGVQLRLECASLLRDGEEEPVGRARLTGAYNLPAKAILHTVGPRVTGPLTDEHRRQLASCYRACLQEAEQNRFHTLAFCCISTGEFHFPAREAAQIAVSEARGFLRRGGRCRVIFNVFRSEDLALYRELLSV